MRHGGKLAVAISVGICLVVRYRREISSYFVPSFHKKKSRTYQEPVTEINQVIFFPEMSLANKNPASFEENCLCQLFKIYCWCLSLLHLFTGVPYLTSANCYKLFSVIKVLTCRSSLHKIIFPFKMYRCLRVLYKLRKIALKARL